MKTGAFPGTIAVWTFTAIFGVASDSAAATLQPQTMRAWNTYVAATEARIAHELSSPRGFLVTDFTSDAAAIRDAIRRGALPIGKLTTPDTSGKAIAVPDGLIAHWRGAVFLPGVTVENLLHR